ncbi:MAG: hypothetical protein ABW022_17795 [Actinoplanes sp.]
MATNSAAEVAPAGAGARWIERLRRRLWNPAMNGAIADDRRRSWEIRNNTPRPVWLEHDNRIFTLAPLEVMTWSPSGRRDHAGADKDPRQAFPALERLIDRHQVEVTRPRDEAPRDILLSRTIRFATIAVSIWLILLWPMSLWWWWHIGAWLGFACALLFLFLWTSPARRRAGREVRRWTFYNATMLGVVAVGILVPAVALYLATDLRHVVSIWPNGLGVDTSKPLELIGRMLQLTFISVATLLPALMYFQFDAERLGTLRDRWIQNVFRLDPTVTTRCDVTAKYGRQLDEAYGPQEDGRGRLTRGRRSPIILTTLILAMGWLLILLKAGDKIAAGKPDAPLTFVSLLDPNQSLVTFAFLGAYFFGLQLVWQSYVRGDLRPKTYTTITVRVLVVVILAWLIGAVTDATQAAEPLYLLAFAAGFVPDRVLHLLWEKGLPKLGRVVDLGRQQQLTELEGADLYERTRLSEEGITSLEALAHHDLLDLFFKTRIQPARLVDWVDQAILIMYLSGESGATQPALDGTVLRIALRRVGIRTASDLVYQTRRTEAGHRANSAERLNALAAIVHAEVPTCSLDQVRDRLRLLASTLDQSEWLGRIENWRRSDLIAADHRRRRYIDAHGHLKYGDPRLAGEHCLLEETDSEGTVRSHYA